MSAAFRASMSLIALTACATARPPARRTDAAACPCTYEVRPYYVNFIPFGAGQFQNRERGKGLAFAIAEGTTGAISAGIWLYLAGTYDRTVPAADTDRVRTLQRVEIGTGFAFLGLATWGVIDAIAGYEPRVEVDDTQVTIGPALVSGGAGLALSWSR